MSEPLTITTSPRDDRQLDLHIQLGPIRTEEALKRAARQISAKVNVPGFRRGKAPFATVLRTYGRDTLLHEILDDLGQEVYLEALETEKLEPFRQANLVDVELDPIVFKLLVPQEPIVELNDYRSLRVEAPEVVVTDEDVEQLLQRRREQKAHWDETTEPASIGDTVVIDIVGRVGEETVMDNQDWEFQLRGESGWLPGFDESFVGLSAGEEKSFELTYPEDSSSKYKGQVAHFEVTVKKVLVKHLPELDDDFARDQGDYADLADLQSKLREILTQNRTREAEAKLNQQALEALAGVATLQYPPVLVEEMIGEMLESQSQQLARSGYKLEDYLRLQGLTVEAYQTRLKPQAELEARNALLIGQLAQAEGISPDDAAIHAEIDRVVSNDVAAETEENQALRSLLESPQGHQLVARDLRVSWTLKRLREIVTGQAPELPAQVESAGKEPAEAAADAPVAPEITETEPGAAAAEPAAQD